MCVLHVTVGALVDLVLAPFAIDGVHLEPTLDRIGVVFGADLAPGAVWALRPGPRRDPDAAALGQYLAAALAGPTAAVRSVGRIGRPGMEAALLDRVDGAARQLDGHPERSARNGWAIDLVAGTGWRSPLRPRSFDAVVDGGPAITCLVPRVCCVFHRRPSAGACPTCPSRPDDDDRRSALTDWIRTLGDREAALALGRGRLDPLDPHDGPPPRVR